MKRLGVLAGLVAMIVGASGAGCAAPEDSASSSTDAVTSIENTNVKRQSIGSCWLHASLAWAEALHLRASGEKVNLSETYLQYWRWFDDLAAASASGNTPGALAEGVREPAIQSTVSGLIQRYGLMHEKDFYDTDSVVQTTRTLLYASGVAFIEADINRALKDEASPLRRAMAAKDRIELRRALDRIWGLDAAITRQLDEVFGQDAAKTFDRNTSPLPAGATVFRASTFAVSSPTAPGTFETLTLADVLLGGKAAWAYVTAPQFPLDQPKTRRAFDQRLQHVLNDGFPMPIAWWVNFDAQAIGGAFKLSELPSPEAPAGGGHLSLITDYEVDDVPGFGTLRAGETERRPDALAASLDDRAFVRFYRVKNSWGSFRLDGGYNDLWTDYLYRFQYGYSVLMPPGY